MHDWLNKGVPQLEMHCSIFSAALTRRVADNHQLPRVRFAFMNKCSSVWVKPLITCAVLHHQALLEVPDTSL